MSTQPGDAHVFLIEDSTVVVVQCRGSFVGAHIASSEDDIGPASFFVP
jgi:hypothetical protein